MAGLGWSVRQYLDATPHEYFAAYEVWKRLNIPDTD